MYRREKALMEFQAGDIIFHEGERGNRLFIIQDGEVEITKQVDDEEIPLVNLKAGSVFGEMALIDTKCRTATARAFDKVTCLSMSQAMFRHKLTTEVPGWMQSIFGAVVDRLRVTTIRSVARQRQVPGRQIVALLAMFLQRGETTQSGHTYIPWDYAAKKIAYILGIKEKQVNQVMEILANSEFSGFEIERSGSRRFLAKPLDTFLHFADYCEESLLVERRKKEPDRIALEAMDYKVLSAIIDILEAEKGVQTISQDEIFERLKEKLGVPSESCKETAQRLLDQGIIETQSLDDGTAAYLISLDLCRQKVIAYKLRDTFEKLTQKLSDLESMGAT